MVIVDSVRFVVPGPPVPQPRQRHRVVRGVAMNYTPKTHPVWGYKAAAALVAAEALPAGWDKAGMFSVSVVFVMPRPQKLGKKNPGRAFAPVRPDMDNFCKSLFDGLTGTTWVDDGQIVSQSASKFYAAAWEEPCTEVYLALIGR